MTHIFAIANQKGGVGKTTTAVNLAASLAACGKKVLLIDLDPQGNATMGSGIYKNDVEFSAYDVLVDKKAIDQVVLQSPEGNYDLVAANQDLTAAELKLMDETQRESRLRFALNGEVKEKYDYILLDCPPSLGMLALNGLVAAEGVFIPMQCEYFALEGLSDLINTIKHVTEMVNPNLRVEGILRCMYDGRTSLTQEVSDQLVSYFADKLYHTVIPRNIRLAEAPSHGKPVLAYDNKSRGAEAYMALAKEMIARNEKTTTSFTPERKFGQGLGKS